MSYRCQKCKAVAPHHSSQYKRLEYREVIDEVTKRVRKEIQKETVVCRDCYDVWQKTLELEAKRLSDVQKK